MRHANDIGTPSVSEADVTGIVDRPLVDVPAESSAISDLDPRSFSSRLILEFSAFAAREHDLDKILARATQTIRAALGVECRICKPSETPDRDLLQDSERARSHTFVAIDGETAPFGAFAMVSSCPGAFSPEDIEFVQWVARIVTDSLRRAHYLRDRARLASLVAATNEAVVSITRDGRIFSWNQVAESLCGYSGADVIGQPLTDLFPANVTADALAALGEVWLNTNVGPMETVIRRRDGTEVEAEVRFAPIVVPGGLIAAASMIVCDMRVRHPRPDACRCDRVATERSPGSIVVIARPGKSRRR